MEITINDQQKVFAIQKEFSKMFPFLKLEFYSKSKKGGMAPYTELMKHISRTIAECRTIHSSGFITIQPHMTVSELVQGFRDTYGLSVGVFRKTEDTWLDTSETDELTLERQNGEAKELSSIERVV